MFCHQVIRPVTICALSHRVHYANLLPGPYQQCPVSYSHQPTKITLGWAVLLSWHFGVNGKYVVCCLLSAVVVHILLSSLAVIILAV